MLVRDCVEWNGGRHGNRRVFFMEAKSYRGVLEVGEYGIFDLLGSILFHAL